MNNGAQQDVDLVTVRVNYIRWIRRGGILTFDY